MLLSSSQNWGGTSAKLAVALLVTLVLGFALVHYVEWSSNARFAEFIDVADASAPILPHKGRTGCEQGNKSLPSELQPLN
ncbi:hypothetical protein ABIB82_002853 [Bradyrhizobium sp. i1.8.4]|uniref:hypothetical protein n=1 Tax=unclassified Bradyrhizobium TaxID=2631580 RepID=UPI003D1B98F8